MTAEIEVPKDGAEGMLVTQGGNFGGYGLDLLKGRPVFAWNLLGMEKVRWEAGDALATGKHTLVFDYKYDGGGIAKGGQGVLRVDGKDVATKRMERSRRGPSRFCSSGTRRSTSASTRGRPSSPRTTRCHSPSRAR
jgi:arylsulfatase